MNLFTLDNLSNDEVISIVKDACVFDFSNRNIKNKADRFVVGILFFEPSTRTRYSFEIAAKRLGIKTLTLIGDNSTSLAKGESLFDTVKTFQNIGVDALVIRHPQKEYYKELKEIDIPILSGGDGSGDHPTQSLLDLTTIYNEFGKFNGLKVSILGDIKYSRVAATNIKIMKRLGMIVSIVAPNELTIDGINNITNDQALKESDVIMALRVQSERHNTKLSISNEEFNKKYGINKNNIKLIKDKAIILHPGPVNWGVELDSSIIKHPACRINQQVEFGVKIRALLLERTLLCK